MDSGNNPYRIRKPKSSCTECRRRKQRCNRIWPCNHCTKRNIGHLCHFLPVRQKAAQATIKKRLCDESSPRGEGSSQDLVLKSWDGVDEAAPCSLETWGYTKGLRHFNLSELNLHRESQNDDAGTHAATDNALQTALRALPNRSLTDDLVKHYLQDGNMQYYSIHPPSFMRAYENFWSARTQSINQPFPAFTCLLLQICSNASQRLHTPLKQRLEYDLTENHVQTSKRLFDAAEGLSRAMPPGVGSVEKVLRMLLAAAWLKSEGRIVDGWHALSVAVREAQECGLDRDDTSGSTDRMEVEIRRRAWCFIVVWDWQMAEWLSRPMLVNVACKIPPLTPLVDCTSDGRPSPISNLSQQFRLVQAVSSRFGRLSEIRERQAVQEALNIIEEWEHQLPAELSMNNADLSWDDQCLWLPLQRAQLRLFAQMMRLTPLKHFLTSPSKTDGRSDLRYIAVQACIDCVNAAIVLADVMNPIQMAFHFVIFALFDTGTLICSAILHQGCRNLPQHNRLLDYVRKTLATLEAMSNDAVSAHRSALILRWLLGRLESIKGESLLVHAPVFSARKESLTDAATPSVFTEVDAEEKPTQQPHFLTKLSSSEQSQSLPSDLMSSPCTVSQPGVDLRDANGDDDDDNDDSSWLCKGDLSIHDLTDLDLGGMESIWDWEALDFDSAF